MHQTGYLPLVQLSKAPGPYIGGLCKWWYTPIQNILSFPDVDPVTQQLVAAPTLKPGAQWYGPVKVPDGKLGWDQVQDATKAGTFYKQKVTGMVPGHDESGYITMGNMTYHQFCIMGQLRSGGFHVIIGNNLAGLRFTHNTETGTGGNDTPGSPFTFTGETMEKALIVAQ